MTKNVLEGHLRCSGIKLFDDEIVKGDGIEGIALIIGVPGREEGYYVDATRNEKGVPIVNITDPDEKEFMMGPLVKNSFNFYGDDPSFILFDNDLDGKRYELVIEAAREDGHVPEKPKATLREAPHAGKEG
jgi:hypothetical protein